MTLLCWKHVIVYSSKPVEYTPARVNPGVYSGLWVMMTCGCKFILGDIGTILVGDGDNGGRNTIHVWEQGEFGETLSFPHRCNFEPKTALKI